MVTITQIVLAVSAGLIGVVAFSLLAIVGLQNGCQEEEAKNCLFRVQTTSLASLIDNSAICRWGTDFVNCIKDNACCDHDESGLKMRTLVRTYAGRILEAGCTIPSCD
mmetsp:Transcript_110522/g.323352  ORF Transcript_110522/g.323352 Transcript_110522/m.323352 type:complete len:108 (+) Transcript_110522:53-376(+)